MRIGDPGSIRESGFLTLRQRFATVVTLATVPVYTKGLIREL